MYVPILASENLGVFLALTSLLALASAHEKRGLASVALSALAGFLFCSLVLTRPAAGTLTAPAFALLAFYHPYLRKWSISIPATFLVFAAITFAPWSMRNYHLGLSPLTISTQSGAALWWDVRRLMYPRPYPNRPPEAKGLSEEGQSRVCRELAKEWILNNPTVYLYMCRARFIRVFGGAPDPCVLTYLLPTRQNDRELLGLGFSSTEQAQAAPETLEGRRANMQWRARWVLRPYGAVLAALMAVGIVLALPQWRAFAFALLPPFFYLGVLIATVFTERYRELSNALLVIPTGALLADVFFGTRDLGRRIPRWGKGLLALAVVGLGCTLNYGGTLIEWMRLPPLWVANPAVPEEAFEPVSFAGPPKTYGIRTAPGFSVVREGEGLRCTLTAGEASAKGGFRFPVKDPKALRLDLSFIDAPHVRSMRIDACNESGRLIHRWAWNDAGDYRAAKQRHTYVLVPGQQTGYFQIDGPSTLQGARYVDIRASVERGSTAGFILHRAEVAASLEPERPAQFTTVEMPKSLSRCSLPGNRNFQNAVVERAGAGLRFAGKAGSSGSSSLYGGVRFGVPRLDALRLALQFEHSGAVECVVVDAYAPGNQRRARWIWRRQPSEPLPTAAQTFLFRPGEPADGFQAQAADSLTDVSEIRVSIKVSGGQQAGLVIHSVEAGTRPTASAPTDRSNSRPAATAAE